MISIEFSVSFYSRFGLFIASSTFGFRYFFSEFYFWYLQFRVFEIPYFPEFSIPRFPDHVFLTRLLARTENCCCWASELSVTEIPTSISSMNIFKFCIFVDVDFQFRLFRLRNFHFVVFRIWNFLYRKKPFQDNLFIEFSLSEFDSMFFVLFFSPDHESICCYSNAIIDYLLHCRSHERTQEELELVFEELLHIAALSHLSTSIKRELASIIVFEAHPDAGTIRKH